MKETPNTCLFYSAVSGQRGVIQLVNIVSVKSQLSSFLIIYHSLSLMISFLYEGYKLQLQQIMAKLEKGFEDYFKIPILLKPVGQTPTTSIKKIYQMLNAETQSIQIDERYQQIQTAHSKILQKRQPHTPQTIQFRMVEFVNEWSEFEVIYRCRFCVGVFDSAKGNLPQQWAKALKFCTQQNRKMVGLIILSIQNCEVEGIKTPYIIIPQKLASSEFSAFLQPWLYTILPPMQDHICYLISELQKEDNGFIVFNKVEQKPQPRTLKRKKRGRCLKICGDFCLVLHLIKQAYSFYLQAQQILKKVDDYLWALGCNQGKLACFTTDFEPEGKNKQQILQQVRNECLNLGRKVKIPQLQTENYFKVLKIYTKISGSFDEMARDFLNYILANYSSSQKFSVLTQLAMLYKEAGMMRKHNYALYLSSRIAMELKPSLVGIILNEILKSGHIKQWPLINANVIKLLIDNGNDSKQGQLHLDLIESCCSVLTPRDIQVTLQALQSRNFQPLTLQSSLIFDIVSINCIESEIKPKLNKLAQQSPSKTTQGFFMNWRKKEIIYQFQQNQIVKFELKIRNNMNFSLRCEIKLHFQKPSNTKWHSFYLHPKTNKLQIQQIFSEINELIILEAVQFKIFNFTYMKVVNQFAPVKLQIYEQYPDFKIKIPEIFRNQESSLFEFLVAIQRTKSYLQLARAKLTISIYYTIQVGFQQTQYEILNLQQQKYLVVASDYPYDKPQDSNLQLIRLLPFKAHKKYLKKIECKIDAIRTQNSKYQISKIQNSNCLFQRSIWCELISIMTPTQVKFKREDENIIEKQFIIKIAVHKKNDDLTPYKITQSKQSYILSQKTMIVIEKTLDKIPIVDNREINPLQIVFEWCNLIRQKQCGTIAFEVPLSPKMFLPLKQVSFTVQNWNKKERQQLNGPAEIKVHYILKPSTCNLSHNVIVKPLNLPGIKKYLISGKTKIKHRQADEKIVNNSLAINFFYEYNEEYMIGLNFQDASVYWFPCIFAIVK